MLDLTERERDAAAARLAVEGSAQPLAASVDALQVGRLPESYAEHRPALAPLAAPRRRMTLPVLTEGLLVARAIDQLVDRSGLTKTDVARRMGIDPTTFRKTLQRQKHRKRPTHISLCWFSRLVAVCGAHLVIELSE